MAFQVVLLAALISLSVAELEVPGRLVSLSKTLRSESYYPSCDGINVYSACKDCDKVLVCMGSASDEKDCATASPDTPFCVNGACSAMADSAAGCFPPSMTCTGVGFYPDPKNCQTYHYCEGINQASSVYVCPPNYVYNATSALCKQKNKTADCVTVKCNKNQIFSIYGTSMEFFAYCQYNGTDVKSIIMLKCEPYSAFDGETCVFTCPKEGNFQHADATKYYQCYKLGANFVYQEQNCTAGRIFDNQLKVCITAPKTAALN